MSRCDRIETGLKCRLADALQNAGSAIIDGMEFRCESHRLPPSCVDVLPRPAVTKHIDPSTRTPRLGFDVRFTVLKRPVAAG